MKPHDYLSPYLVPQQSRLARRIRRGVWRRSLTRRLPSTTVMLGLAGWAIVFVAGVWSNGQHNGLSLPGGISSGTAMAATHTTPAVAVLAGGPSGGLLPPGTLAAYGTYANSYTRGQCTWYVASRRPVPNNWGNARTWYGHAQALGWSTGTTPAVGAIAWTSAGYYGHVAVVEAVNGNSVMVAEMNYNGPYQIDRRWTTAGSWHYIY